MSEKETFTLYTWLPVYMILMHTSCLLLGLTVNNNVLFKFLNLKDDFDFCISVSLPTFLQPSYFEIV